jgi:hypothetical protein
MRGQAESLEKELQGVLIKGRGMMKRVLITLRVLKAKTVSVITIGVRLKSTHFLALTSWQTRKYTQVFFSSLPLSFFSHSFTSLAW